MPKVLIFLSVLSFGCTRVHHVQIGAIDNTVAGVPINVVITDIGVDAAKIARRVEQVVQINKKRKKRKKSTVSDVISLFQVGPKTGAPVYNEHWGEHLLKELHLKCPSGRLKNVHSRRLSTDYGDTGVTKEIVVVDAICIRDL